MNIGERWVNAFACDALTDEQRAVYESGPKNLGRLVSAKSKKHDEPAAEGATESGESRRAAARATCPPARPRRPLAASLAADGGRRDR